MYSWFLIILRGIFLKRSLVTKHSIFLMDFKKYNYKKNKKNGNVFGGIFSLSTTSKSTVQLKVAHANQWHTVNIGLTAAFSKCRFQY